MCVGETGIYGVYTMYLVCMYSVCVGEAMVCVPCTLVCMYSEWCVCGWVSTLDV